MKGQEVELLKAVITMLLMMTKMKRRKILGLMPISVSWTSTAS